MTHLDLKYDRDDHDQEYAPHPPAHQLDQDYDDLIPAPHAHQGPDYVDHQPAQQQHPDHETGSPRFVQQHCQDGHIVPPNLHQPDYHSPELTTQLHESPDYGSFPPAQHSSSHIIGYDSCTTDMQGVQYDYPPLDGDNSPHAQDCLTPTNKGEGYTTQQVKGKNISTPPSLAQYGYDSPSATQHESSDECADQNSDKQYEILREPEHDKPANLSGCCPGTDERILDQSGGNEVQSTSLLENYAITDQEDHGDTSDNSLESEEENIEPPSPIFKRDMRVPAVWPRIDSSLSRTPTRQSVIKPNLDSIFEISNVDLKGKLVQIIDFSGANDNKSQLKMKISDGDTWIEVFLDNVYKLYFCGKMLEINHLVNIVEYTGSIELDNVVLVSN